MNLLNGCLSRFGRTSAPRCRDTIKAVQSLNGTDDKRRKTCPCNIVRNGWSLKYCTVQNLRVISVPFMWTQVRFKSYPAKSLHRDIKFPNFDHYRKDQYKDVRKTTWGLGDGKPGYVYIFGVFGFVCGAYSVKSAVYHLVSVMAPAADVLALASIEVDLSKVRPGACMSFKWRGKPLFVKNRTEVEIAAEEKTPVSTLRDPQTPEQRAPKGEWLIVIGICTHLGCVPIPNSGDYVGGFYCPCHGSHYDNIGRIRKGPAPLNLDVPPYVFLSDTLVRVG